MHVPNSKIVARDVDVFYGQKQAINAVSMDIAERQITAFIGPSGCGKSTFLRVLNRMNDVIPDCHVHGDVLLDGEDIYARHIDPVLMRARVGMVFQKPNPFPKSIFDNVAFGPTIHQLYRSQAELSEMVHHALEQVGMMDELKDRLHDNALGLSGGQQQRVCIARALAVSPEVILMDEPCSALDPIATARIEQLMEELVAHYTIVVVTHSMQQAGRISNRTAFFHLGSLIEMDDTHKIFNHPSHEKTLDYVTGRFG